jgi:hypothetical protein
MINSLKNNMNEFLINQYKFNNINLDDLFLSNKNTDIMMSPNFYNKKQNFIVEETKILKGCLGAFKYRTNQEYRLFFPNTFGIELKILKKYIKIILSINSYINKYIKILKISKEGVEIDFKGTDNNFKTLFLFYFFRAISNFETVPFVINFVKGVDENLNINESFIAATFTSSAKSNYFCISGSNFSKSIVYNDKFRGIGESFNVSIFFVFLICRDLKNFDLKKSINEIDSRINNSFFNEINIHHYSNIFVFNKYKELNELYKKLKNEKKIKYIYNSLKSLSEKYSIKKIEINKKNKSYFNKKLNIKLIETKKIYCLYCKEKDRYYFNNNFKKLVIINKKFIKKTN